MGFEMDELIRQTTQLLGAVLAAALVALVTQGLRKLGLSITMDQQAQLERTVRLGVGYAEEQARAHLAQTNDRLPGTSKQLMAASFVMEALPHSDETAVHQLIQAVLPSQRQTITAMIQK
jgi:hypothetical protein